MHFGTFTPPEPAGPRYATDACAASDLSKRSDELVTFGSVTERRGGAS
jgi:hypothetical protein